MKVLDAVDDFLYTVEKWALIILLSFLMIMAFVQVVLRNLFSTGFVWADILLRNSVLWIALLGASIATRERKHIAIDVVSRYFSIRKKYVIEIIVSIVSVYVCCLLASAALTFLKDERDAGSILVLNIPTWYFLLIVPFAFYAIAFRFSIRVLKRSLVLIKGAK
ncbi:MAG: TRAP transporter small permease [Candidatus Anammoxibacter sp.]